MSARPLCQFVASLLVLLAAAPSLADTQPTLLPGKMPTLSQGRGSAAPRFSPAPVPNLDLIAPTSPRDPTAVQVSPGLTRMNAGQAHSGDGFARGSAYLGEFERRGRGGLGAAGAPSLNLKMPLQMEFR